MLKVLLQKLIKFKRKNMNNIKIKLSVIANSIAIFALSILTSLAFTLQKILCIKVRFILKQNFLKQHKFL